jgi:SAM-dependent methyltransferase
MIHIQECPICNSNAFHNVFTCKDYSISKESFDIIQCNSCKLLITSPRPSGSGLSKYYSSEEYISHSDTAKGFINKLYHRVRKITLKQKVALIKRYSQNPVLLDIGSGAGYFINSCKLNDIHAVGIEPDEKSRARSVRQFNIEVFDEGELDRMPASIYDVITLWHVLEHVEDLGKRINQIYRLLKDDGIAVIALPNCSSFDAKHYQMDWAGYDVPRHLWHFTADTIQLLFRKKEFELISIYPMSFDAYYVSMLSEKYRNTRFGILRGFILGFISNLKASWYKNNSYSSQIYLFRKKQ